MIDTKNNKKITHVYSVSVYIYKYIFLYNTSPAVSRMLKGFFKRAENSVDRGKKRKRTGKREKKKIKNEERRAKGREHGKVYWNGSAATAI